jgi:DNA-binding beta-propeller fold protein YncE
LILIAVCAPQGVPRLPWLGCQAKPDWQRGQQSDSVADNDNTWRTSMRSFALAAIVLATATLPAAAEFAVSANDGKVKLIDGVATTVKDGKDTVSIIDLSANPPKIVAEFEVAASVAGPPTSVAISPKGDIALVTAAEKYDPADGTKRIPNDVVTLIDLTTAKPSLIERGKAIVSKAPAAAVQVKVLATLTAGKGAAGVSFNKAGTLALVANRAEGTVSVFTVAGKTVTAAGKVDLGNDKSGPSAVSFTPDGKQAYVTLDGESANKIAILTVDGAKVEYAKRDMNAGLRPYGMDIAKAGDIAVVANIGRGNGDSDTISVIDMKMNPPRVVNTVTVGQTPEGIKMSPDGKFIAVSVMNGSNKKEDSPYYNAQGLLLIYGRTGTQLNKIAEAKIGKWCQGIAWSSNSKKILAQCMVEEEIHVFNFGGLAGKALTKGASIKTKGGPAGIRTAE